MSQPEPFLIDLARLRAWVKNQKNSSFDPYDLAGVQPYKFLFQRYDHLAYRGLLRGAQAAAFYFPKTIRFALGVQPTKTAGALYHQLMAELELYRTDPNEALLFQIQEGLRQLILLREKDSKAWGLPFSLPRCGGADWPSNTSYAHTTLRVVELFLKYEKFTGDLSFQSDWIQCLDFLFYKIRWKSIGDLNYCSYLALEDLWIINVMADMALQLSDLHERGLLPKGSEGPESTAGLVRAILNSRDANGRWPYGVRLDGEETDPSSATIDSIHTSMVLKNLGVLAQRKVFSSSFPHLSEMLEESVNQYLADFFPDPDGRPISFLGIGAVIDIGCWPESVRAYCAMNQILSAPLRLKWLSALQQSYGWIRQHMYDERDGTFAYQYRNFLGTYRLKSLRWGNSLMLEAMEYWRSVRHA